MSNMIPIAEPNLTGNESQCVRQAIASNWVSGGGPFVRRFEEMVAKASGREWCVATLSGTAALHVALTVAGVKRDSEITMRAMNFIAPANVLSYLGASPYFKDIDVDWSPDHSWIGYEVLDAAPAITLINKKITAQLVCFSFNGNKTITTGQGGAVVGNENALESQVRHLVEVAKTGPFEHNKVGFNYRMADINAAIGCAQMERLDEFRECKNIIMRRYQEAGIRLVPSCWMALWQTSRRDEKISRLRLEGINARPFWKPLHHQIPYCMCPHYNLDLTEKIWGKLICLPCSTNLTQEQQDKVIKICASLSGDEED